MANDNLVMLLTASIVPAKYGLPKRWQATASLSLLADDGTPRNISFGSVLDGTSGLAGHSISASFDEDDAAKGRGPYVDGPYIDGGVRMSLREAEATGKVAARVLRRLDKMALQRGYGDSWITHFLRYAEALGVSRFVFQVSGTSEWYNENKWYVATPGEAERWLADRCEANRQKFVGAAS